MQIEVNVTRNCNMHCSYCFAKPSRSAAKLLDVDKTLEWITSFIHSNYYIWRNWTALSRTSLAFWGGEPTTEPGIVKQLCEYCSENDLDILLMTNGLDIQPVLDCLEQVKDRLRIQVSYDGNSIQQGHAHTQKVIDNIKLLDSLGFRLGCKPAIGWTELDKIYQSYLDYKNLDEQLVNNHMYYYPSIDFSHPPKQEDVTDILNILTSQLLAIKADTHPTIGTRFLYSDRMDCNAGHSMLAIDVDGTIYPCHSAISSKCREDHVLGTIYESIEDIGELMTKYAECLVNTPNDVCSNCPATCYNRCRIFRFDDSKKESYQERWTDLNSNPVLCQIYRHITKIMQV